MGSALSLWKAVVLWLLISAAYAVDINATDQNGRQVVLHENGTWEEASPALPQEDGEPKSCDALVSTVADQMTGDSHEGLKEAMIISDDGQTGLIINLMRAKANVIWITTAVGASSCADDEATLNVLFRDGTRQEIKSNTNFNCDGQIVTYMGRPFRGPALLEVMASKEVATIRAWTRDGYVQRDLTPEQSLDLMTSFSCLK